MPNKTLKKTPKDLAVNEPTRPTPTADADDDNSFGACNACSSGDCTGLIQTPPQNEGELEALAAVYNFLPPDVCQPMDKSREKRTEK